MMFINQNLLDFELGLGVKWLREKNNSDFVYKNE